MPTSLHPLPAAFLLGAFVSLSSVLGTSPARAEEAPVDFSREIRPLLAEKCFHCHGLDAHSRKADLRLDLEEGATADLGGYAAFVAGNPGKSEALARVHESDAGSVMPPPEFGKPLSEEEKNLLARWVAEGAVWNEHWSFVPVARPEPAPEALADPWARNPIDAFTLPAMRARGLEPSPEAERHALARRAALDLTGLPPGPEALDAFLADEAPEAYERYVDRLLDSPHAAEHLARFWLDAARYGDTHGMHLDNVREMWPYRDWVIEAYRRNLPFDRFLVEQLAGDLLESPDRDQLVATGFLRNNVSTSEGGSIVDEVRARYLLDRTETVSTVFLGLTAGCAACHDHKFDPISQREFYELGAFFAAAEEAVMDGNMRDTYPVVTIPHPEHAEEWETLSAERERLAAGLASLATEEEAAAWWDKLDPVAAAALAALPPVPEEGLALHLPLDKFADGLARARTAAGEIEVPLGKAVPAEDHPHGPDGRRGVRFPENGGFTLPLEMPFSPSSPVTVSYWVRTPDLVEAQTLLTMYRGENKEKELKATGWQIIGEDRGGFSFRITDAAGTMASAIMPSETPLRPAEWQHVAVRYGGGQALSSAAPFVEGEHRFTRRGNDTLLGESFGEGLSEILTVGASARSGGLSDLRIYSRWLDEEEIGLLADEFAWRELLASAAGENGNDPSAVTGEGLDEGEAAALAKRPSWSELDAPARELVRRHHRVHHLPDAAERRATFAATVPRHDWLYARNPTTLVMKEGEGPTVTAVLDRGEYDQPLETVSAGTPAILPPLARPEDREHANRLDLARWLVDPAHPLTARVTANRLWQILFGTGIVKTAGDFGVMGEAPTHTELLDWLAAEFVESGWDVKALLRTVATSATYRQDATRTPAMLERDPENRYLSAGPRRRLDAEVLRDQALAVAGILDPRVGGESVKPYQPEGVWKTVAFTGSNTANFVQDPLGKIHRRSVYTFWKRTAIHPAFAVFDAPSREECAVVRERTNTPLQALVLMNDVQHVEAARSLAEAIVSRAAFPEAGDEFEALAAAAFLRVVGRPAAEDDLLDLEALATMARHQYRSDSEAAQALVRTGDLPHDESLDPVEVATWTLLINLLLNRDDVINQS